MCQITINTVEISEFNGPSVYSLKEVGGALDILTVTIPCVVYTVKALPGPKYSFSQSWMQRTRL